MSNETMLTKRKRVSVQHPETGPGYVRFPKCSLNFFLLLLTFSPFGLNATEVTSYSTSIVSCSDFVSKQFQILIVLSQEPETSIEEVGTGEKAIEHTGPS